METTRLGQHGPEVKSLCLGTWAWGDKLFWNYGKEYSEEQLREAFLAAITAGTTFFDTAEIYGFGLSEEFLGQFIQQTQQSVQIATKYLPLPWRFTTEAVSQALTASLNRLKTQSVTLYQVHMPFNFFMSQQTLMDALAQEVKQGRIAAVGVSNYSAEQMREAHQLLAAHNVPLAVNQVSYSLLTRQIETNGVLATARQLGITILAYSPLAQGLLTGKYNNGSGKTPTGARRLDPRFSAKGLRKIEPVITVLQQLGEKHGRTPAQVALNWLIAQGNVIPIAGVKTAEQVQQNAGALGWQLTPEEVEQLGAV